ncbi:hypothetical protein M426DRAFT_14368 [Hypoxylon sp. CI-4A]|nr:hypothetical protein M426DRAFT_14368 [Hypoxylon sp. CI-4A]
MERLIDIDPQPLAQDCQAKSTNSASALIMQQPDSNHEATLQQYPVMGAFDNYNVSAATSTEGWVEDEFNSTDKKSKQDSQSTPDEVYFPPGPLPYPRFATNLPSVMNDGESVTGRSVATTTANGAATTLGYGGHHSDQAQVNFIVSHDPEMTAGVIEAVYKEVNRASRGGKIELVKTRKTSYLRIVAPKKQIDGLVAAVQDITEELLASESTQRVGIFQEPPTGAAGTSQVVIEIDPLSQDGRPRLQPGADTAASFEFPESFEKYETKLTDRVYKGLKKAGRIPLSLTLRIHLGHFMLRNYNREPKAWDYRAFHGMVKDPRASGWLKTRIGDETWARRLIDFVKHDVSSSFSPTGVEATLAAAKPEYGFEIRSENIKFDIPIHRGPGGVCRVYSITACPLNTNFAEVDIANLSIGRNFDWKMEAVNEEKGARTFPEVVRYLRTAAIELKGLDQPHNLNTYPRIKLEPLGAVARDIKEVTVKTLYQFRWKSTSFIVQVAINRRWESLYAMKRERPPTMDLGISIFGSRWDSEEDDTAGNIWGDDLQNLLDRGPTGAAAGGTDRVAYFLQMVREIRDALEQVFSAGTGLYVS